MNQIDLETIKQAVEEFLQKMTLSGFSVKAEFFGQPDERASDGKQSEDCVDIALTLSDPQLMIGQNGQTLFEVQRVLKILLQRKLKKSFYVNLDINDYKKKKDEHLRLLARDLADEVALSGKQKTLPPMPNYQRRIIHAQLAGRQDVVTQSEGEGLERHLVIRPR